GAGTREREGGHESSVPAEQGPVCANSVTIRPQGEIRERRLAPVAAGAIRRDQGATPARSRASTDRGVIRTCSSQSREAWSWGPSIVALALGTQEAPARGDGEYRALHRPNGLPPWIQEAGGGRPRRVSGALHEPSPASHTERTVE